MHTLVCWALQAQGLLIHHVDKRHELVLGTCCFLTRPLKLFPRCQNTLHKISSNALKRNHMSLLFVRAPALLHKPLFSSWLVSCLHLLEPQVLTVNNTTNELSFHSTLIVGLSQMLVELHVALIIFGSVGLDLLAPGCSMSSTPRYTADPLAAPSMLTSGVGQASSHVGWLLRFGAQPWQPSPLPWAQRWALLVVNAHIFIHFSVGHRR